MKNIQVAWFEIPVADLDRARTFYEAVFDLEMKVMDLGVLKMALFSEETGSGALVVHPQFYFPSEQGVLLHLDANPNLSTMLDQVEPSGGKILFPKRQISPERGYMAIFIDTESNFFI